MILKKNLFLVILLVTVFLNSLLWIAAIPFNQAPDEFSHYSIPLFIVKNGRYPVFGKDVTVVEYKGNRAVSLAALPPLAYLIQAAAIKIGSLVVEEKNWYLLARLTSSLAILAYLYFSWRVLLLLTEGPLFQKATIVLLAFIPEVTFLASYVNSDAMALGASSFLLWQMVKIFKKGPDSKNAILLGLAAGLTLLSRLNTYVLLPFVFLALVNHRKLKFIIYFLAGSMVVAGWWFWRNIILYGEILPLTDYSKTHYLIWPQDQSHLAISKIIFQTNWIWTTFRSFWASFDWNFLFLPDIYYIILAILLGTSILGLFKYRRSKIILMFLVITIATIFQSLLSSSYFSFQPQGRYLYAALLPVVFLASFGLVYLFQNQIWQKTILILTAWGTVCLNIASLVFIILPRYYSSAILYLSQMSFSKPSFLSQGPLIIYIFALGLCLSFIAWDFLAEVSKNGRIRMKL